MILCFRLRFWAKFCYPNKDFSSIDDLSKLQRSCKVLCGQHFEDSAYCGSDRRRLNQFAVPTLEIALIAQVSGPSTSTQVRSKTLF